MASEVVVGFGGGEVSRNIESRNDLDFYKMSASIAENANILPEGGAKYRAGTEYISDPLDPTKPCVIRPFSFSDEYSYHFEFQDFTLRIWNAQTKTALGTLVTPWTAAQAKKIQYDRLNDVMWVVHPDVPEHVIKRTSISTFTIEETVYDYPPLMEKNLEGITITPSDRTGTNILFTSSADAFTSDMEGSLIAIDQIRAASKIIGVAPNAIQYGPSVTQSGQSGTSNSTIAGQALYCSFSGYRLNTTGTAWRGRIWIEESVDGGVTWEEILFITDSSSGDSQNFILTEDRKRPKGSLIRLAWDLSVGGLSYNLSVEGSYLHGLVEIVSVTSPTTFQGDIVADLYDTGVTSEWYESAFSAKNGYPRCVSLWDGSRWLAGTYAEPSMCWKTRVDEFYNFQIGTFADEGVRRRPPIAKGIASFFSAKDTLILVTSKEVITIVGQNPNEPIGPENIRFIVNTGDGSAYQQSALANDAVLFLQKGSKKVRDMIYSDETRSYVTNDVSALAKHITKKGVEEIALSTLPEQRLYCVTSDGQLAILNYERSEGSVAWTRYVTDGLYNSVSVCDNGEEDSVWYSVFRNGKYRIEAQKSSDLDGFWYLDSATEFGVRGFEIFVADSVVMGAGPDYKVTVTKTDHGLSDGDRIEFSDVTGFDYIDRKVFTVADKTAHTFILKDESDTVYINAFSFNPTAVTASYHLVFNQLTGLDHLEGLDVTCLSNQQFYEEHTVSGGVIDLKRYAGHSVVGSRYALLLSPLPIEALSSFLSIGHLKIINEISVKLKDSYGGFVGTDLNNMEPIQTRLLEDPLGSIPELFNGDKLLNPQDSWETVKRLYIKHDLPYPFELLSLSFEVDGKGR